MDVSSCWQHMPLLVTMGVVVGGVTCLWLWV